MHARFYTCLIVFCLPVLLPVALWAQSDDEVNGGIQFNFSTPGARSLGMGGSFIASVDDATAAYSNPAGLLQLSRAEAFVEGRRWRYEVPFADRGRVSGGLSGIGADFIDGVRLGTAESEVEGISYAAFVLPKPKWALAAYYHQVADFESSFSTGGIFASDSRLFSVQSTYDLDISQAGVAFAYQWPSGVAFGLGVSGYSLRLNSLTQRYGPRSFHAPADFTRDARVNFQTQTGDDQQVGGTVGLLWDRGGPVSTGLVYRYGPTFDLDIATSTFSPDVPIPPRQETHFVGVFNLPDVLGGGITLRPSQSLTVNLDVSYVLYSELIEEMVVIFPEVQDQGVAAEDFVLDDVAEVHLGLEYVLTKLRMPIALRAGAWYDPDHRLRSETGPELNQVRFFAGEDEIHVSAGLGFALKAFQLDAAADYSDVATTATVSAAIRF